MRRALFALLCLAACTGGEQLPTSDPFTVTPNTWTWIDVPESRCDDGSATGLAVNGGTSSNLLVFFNGGGACWDYLTCYGLNTAAHGPFGKAQFDATIGQIPEGSIFNRAIATNPFKDYNFVFVPYCTGDVHAGERIATYEGNTTKTHYHYGHANAKEFAQRIKPTFEKPGKVVIAGSSAGGFGAFFNYDLFRRYYDGDDQKVYLLDDSGPPLIGDAIPGDYRDAWYREWNLGGILDPLCGVECESDFSVGMTKLAAKYPKDRMALLSTTRDQTIRTYFQKSPEDFAVALLQMASTRIDPIDHFRYFFLDSAAHTMLGDPEDFTQNDVMLLHWLGQFVNDDPAWVSQKP
jgi:hypothetical protein